MRGAAGSRPGETPERDARRLALRTAFRHAARGCGRITPARRARPAAHGRPPRAPPAPGDARRPAGPRRERDAGERVMLDPKGRVVMVSGASRGIGRAVVRRLLGAGYTVS